MRKILGALKKIWWLLVAIGSFVFGLVAMFLLSREKPITDEELNELKKEQEKLEREYQELKKKEEEIKKKTYFKNGEEAVEYLNKKFGGRRKDE